MTDLTLSTPGVAGDDRPVGPRRSVRVPYLIGAAALALALAVLVLWGFSRAADRTEVLVVRAPVAAGTPIPASALSTTMVGVDAGVGRLYPAGTDLSGVVAATDLEPGDLLSASMVEAAPELPEGWREVGALVQRGRYPATVSCRWWWCRRALVMTGRCRSCWASTPRTRRWWRSGRPVTG